MAKKTKFFRVATEGATTDGRTITSQMIQEMVASYNPQTYGARINLEHIRGIVPDGPFKSYGDVIALKSETNGEGKLQLLAQLDPTDALVAMTTKDRQKVYTSMEIDPNFARTGQAYLVGLAVTDNPASLGTEMLQFSANAKDSPLAGRKQRPENLFTAAEPFALEFEDETQPGTGITFTVTGAGPSLIERFAGIFGATKPTPPVKAPEAAPTQAGNEQFSQALTLLAESQDATRKLFEQFTTETAQALKTMGDTMQKQRSDHDSLVQKLSATDVSTQRTPATGAKESHVTDC